MKREKWCIMREAQPVKRCHHTLQQPSEPNKQPIRTCYLGHVTGYQPIRDQYFQYWLVPEKESQCFISPVLAAPPLAPRNRKWEIRLVSSPFSLSNAASISCIEGVEINKTAVFITPNNTTK